MSHPFRFGVQLSDPNPDHWREDLRRIEALGFSSVAWPDHFGAQWEPVAALSAAAAATERLRVASLVFDVDYRHPVVLAKASATIHLLSGGRHEFGIGAGWMESDYVEAGMPYDRPGVRISRLEEALQIIRSMWTEEKTSFAGAHYQVKDIARAASLPPGEHPQLMIGGGGRRLLTLAGRCADIVGINPKLVEGRVTAETVWDQTPERVQEKVGFVRAGAEAAGRDPAEIELHATTFALALTEDPAPLRQALAGQSGMSPAEVADCPLFLVGSPGELQERLAKRREQSGVSYVMIRGADLDMVQRFGEEVLPSLAGQ